MKDKRSWFIGWATVSARWVLYWVGMTLALGVEGLHEMIAGLNGTLLVGALCLIVPACLYVAGTAVACFTCAGKSDKPRA